MDSELLFQSTEAFVEEGNRMIQVFKPSYDHREDRAVAEVLASGWSGLGPKTKLFEQVFSEFCSVKYSVGLSNGTAALSMALKLLEIGPGDEVVIPAVTFVSAAHCVVNAGAVPVFSDVLPGSHNIDPKHTEQLINERTKAVIPVHLGGYPVDMDELRCAVKNIPVIEDCAHGAGSYFKGRHAGSIGDIGCFSFHAVKNISMGEGGAVVTNRKDYAERARKLRWLGIDRETWDRSEMDKSYWWEYQIDEIGYKCHMDDIHAAIGLIQLEKLETANSRRREIACLYRKGLQDLAEVVCPPEETDEFITSWHMFRIEAEKRDSLNNFLSSRNISTGVHYKPLHLYKCYGQQPDLPVAEKVFERMLTLPMYPDLTDSQVSEVIDSVRMFYRG